jgi:hypothetical protein
MIKQVGLSVLLLLSISAAPPPAMLTGIWSGDGFSLRAANSQSILQNNCDLGRIMGPIAIDKDGRFFAKGYFNAMTSGYRLSDLAPTDRAAQFSGTVNGNNMALTMLVAGSKKSYTLVRGKTLKFAPCG